MGIQCWIYEVQRKMKMSGGICSLILLAQQIYVLPRKIMDITETTQVTDSYRVSLTLSHTCNLCIVSRSKNDGFHMRFYNEHEMIKEAWVVSIHGLRFRLDECPPQLIQVI